MNSQGDLHVGAVPVVRRWRLQALTMRMAVGLVVALVLVLTFVRLVNVHSVVQRLEHLSVGAAVLCGLVFLSAYIVRALRWRRLLAPDHVSVLRVVALYQVAIFINWLLPLRGGELVKSLLLRRLHAIPLSRSLPTVTIDKAMDLLPALGLLILLPFVPLHLSRALWLLLLVPLAFMGLGALLLGLAAWRRHSALRLLARLTVPLPRGVRERSEPFVGRFIDALLALVARPRLLLIATIYTAVAVGLDALSCWLALRAVGAHVAFPVVLYGYTFYNLAYLLPTPPGQIGSNELIGLLVFCGLFHMNRTVVAAMFLFSHPWTALLMTASGLLSLSTMGLTLRTTLALAQDPARRPSADSTVVRAAAGVRAQGSGVGWRGIQQ
jgi:uncharacterized protein (TIRG00374 family)